MQLFLLVVCVTTLFLVEILGKSPENDLQKLFPTKNGTIKLGKAKMTLTITNFTIIGFGGFAHIFKGKINAHGTIDDVAVKFQYADDAKKRPKTSLQCEFEIYEKLGATRNSKDELNKSCEDEGIPFIYYYGKFGKIFQQKFFLLVMTLFDFDVHTKFENCGLKWMVLPIKTQLEIFRSTLISVKYVHIKGLIHRDLKLENLMIRIRDNKLFLIDFNVAVINNNSTDRIVGTDIYLSGDCLKSIAWEGSKADKNYKKNVHKQNEVDDLFALYHVMRQLNLFNGKINEEDSYLLEPVEKIRNNQTWFEKEMNRLGDDDPRKEPYLNFIKDVFKQRADKQVKKENNLPHVTPPEFYDRHIKSLNEVINRVWKKQSTFDKINECVPLKNYGKK